ncbi:MAG: hypothetical protein JO020_09445 [Chloroflexi bacterium]|nr:hypothetical protein [Chloroflexota bacterium]MBV9894382.1 hypothetical protein [Chloroflexota bacterium]
MSLRGLWDLRNAAAETLVRVELVMRDALQTVSAEEVIALLETFSPARSPGPEWTRSFDPLVEHLWTWCDSSVLADAEARLRQRGGPWNAIANALTPENGERIRNRLQHKQLPSRIPPFTLA